MSAVRSESWTHQLATMTNSRILDIQETMARARTAEENLKSAEERRKVTPALVNYTSGRPGILYRRYLNNNQSRERKFGQGYKPQRPPEERLLCRKCYSAERLLRDCYKLSVV